MDISLNSHVRNQKNYLISNIETKQYIVNTNLNQDINILCEKFEELRNKMNFIKKNIKNEKVLDKVKVNIDNLKNNIDNTISEIDENVISIGLIKCKAIEIEFS